MALEQETEAALIDYLDAVKLDIFFEQDQLDIVASGFSSSNTKVLRGSHSNQAFLRGPDYLFTNFEGVGRRSGTFPPEQAIRNWIRAKGLSPRDEQGRFLTVDQTAFLIARKIGQQGTDIRTGKRKGIPIDAILKRNLPPTGRKLAQAYARDFSLRVRQAQQ